MFKEDDRFVTPDDDAKVWRYMDYDKFRSLIEKQSLYFCSVNTLKKMDPYEGSYYACKLLNEINPSEAQDFVQKASQCGPPIAVNCWHLNESDSMAMWKIYSGSKGIAIQTTIKKLKAAFNKSKDSILLGKVTYTDEPIDHPTGWTVDLFVSCMTKLRCYEHEKEVRALIWETQEIRRTEDGSAIVQIDINSLLESVVLSPESESALETNVCALLGKHEIDIKPRKSPTLTAPVF